MKNLALAAAALTVSLSLITGCAPQASPSEDAPKQVQTIWTAQANLVGTPQIVGDTIVSHVRVKNQLRVAAWDLATGRRLWGADASTSGEAQGIELNIDTVTVDEKTYVAYLTNERKGSWRELVIADVRTGPHKTATSLVVWPSSRPRACSDGKAFCLLGYRPFASRKQVSLRVDPLRPALVTDRSDGIPANSRTLGYDIVATDDRPPKGVERLAQVKDGKITWQRPYTDVFGPSSSSDNGWAWRDIGDDVITGIGYPDLCTITTKKGTRYRTCDDTHARLVGLRHDTGATVWSLEGVDTCPTTSIFSASSEDRIIICRNSAGSSTYIAKDGWWELQNKTRQSELIAVKLQTGEILWHTDLGTYTGGDEQADFVPSEDHLFLSIDGQTTSYDLDTGSSTPTDASSRLTCYRDRPPLKLYRLGADYRSSYNIGEDVEPCDGTGKRIDDIAAEWVPEAGIDAGDGRWLFPVPGAMMLVQLS